MTLTKRILSGTSQLTLSSGVARLFSIVTLPVLTGLLDPSAYGAAALAGTVISLVSVFALAGIDMSYARAYYSAEPPNGAAVERFCWRYTLFTTIPAGIFAGLAWWLITRRSNELDSDLAILVVLGIALSAIHTMSTTRARLAGRYKAMSWATITSGILAAVAAIGIAALWRRDAVALIVAVLMGFLVPVVLLGMPSVFALLKPSGLRWKQGTSLIRIGLAGAVISPMWWLLTSSDRWFIQRYHGTDIVGIYSLGYSVGILGIMVNVAVSSVWLPEASREYEQDAVLAQQTLGRLMSRLFALMALVWLAVSSSGGDIVRWLANERFHGAAQVIPYIAGGIFFYGASQLGLFGLLLAKQLNRAATWWFAGGIMCVLLNFALVPSYGAMGAAIVQLGSFAFICIGILGTSQAKYRMDLSWGRIAVVLTIVLVSGLFMIPEWHETPALSLAIKLPAGIAVSLVVTRVIARDWYDRAIDLFRRKG